MKKLKSTERCTTSPHIYIIGNTNANGRCEMNIRWWVMLLRNGVANGQEDIYEYGGIHIRKALALTGEDIENCEW